MALFAALAGLVLLQTSSGNAPAVWGLTAAGIVSAIGAAPTLMTESFQRHRWVLVGGLLGVGAVVVVGGWAL